MDSPIRKVTTACTNFFYELFSVKINHGGLLSICDIIKFDMHSWSLGAAHEALCTMSLQQPPSMINIKHEAKHNFEFS